jgi:NAD(P)-dependent dehydrogenase (short-subunit alcohol dehydrogenase family)
MGRLDGKVVMITGAGSGMGREATHAFVREGARVVAVDVNPTAVHETVASLQGQALAATADVTREADVAVCVKTAVDHFGKLDVLYNNAGIFDEADESVLTTTDAIWDRTMAINVKGLAFCCKHGIPELIKAGGGSVINIASFVALVGCTVPQDAYTASKGAVIALTKSLAVQFGPKGIRSNAICPGPIETPLMRDLLKDENKKRVRLNRIPMGRFGHADDVVSLAIYLASDESSWTNGAALVVDGGITSNYF